MIEKLYICFINISVSSLLLCFAVLVARYVLKRMPRIFSYYLWAFVLFRFLFPVPVEVPFGLAPTSQTWIHRYSTIEMLVPETDPFEVAVKALKMAFKGDFRVQGIVAGKTEYGYPIVHQDGYEWWEALIYFGQYIWFTGCVVLLVIGLWRYFKFRKTIAAGRCIWKNIYLSDEIKTPVVFGVLDPKIYIPLSYSKHARLLSILHGKYHISRRDPLWKAFAYLMLCIYWINPFVWIVYCLLGKDMEVSCDERVLEKLDDADCADYIRLLDSFSLEKSKDFRGIPMTIVECGGKSRAIRAGENKENIHWILRVAAAIFCIIVGCFAFDHKSGNYGSDVEVIFEQNPSYSNKSFEFEMDEYPGVVFQYKKKVGNLTAIEGDTKKVIIEGNYHSLFLADLNGDGCREFCVHQYTVYGSDKVVVYDYVDKLTYELMDPQSSYQLISDMGGMVTNRRSSSDGMVKAQGKLSIRNRTLQFTGGLNFALGERTTPFVDSDMISSYFRGEMMPDGSHNQIYENGSITTAYNAVTDYFIKLKQDEFGRGLKYTQSTVTISEDKMKQYGESCRYLLLLGELTWPVYQDFVYYNPEKPEQLFVCTEYREMGCKDIETYYRGVVSGSIEAHPETYVICLDEYGIYRWDESENLYQDFVS